MYLPTFDNLYPQRKGGHLMFKWLSHLVTLLGGNPDPNRSGSWGVCSTNPEPDRGGGWAIN